MTTPSPDSRLPLRAPSRDSLEFSAGLLLGVAAGIGIGLALVDSATAGSWLPGQRRKRTGWAGRAVRGLGRG